MIKNHLLYQLSYAGEITTVRALAPGSTERAGFGGTETWYARQDSNLQPSGSKPDALSS